MNKIIAGVFVAAVVASSSLFGCGMGKDRGCCGDRFEKNVKLLNLTEEQKAKIEAIYQKESEKKHPHPFDAFSKTDFDKAKFVKLAKEQREKRMEQRASLMAEVYSVLNPEQKKELHVVLNLKSMMGQNGCGSMKKKSCGEEKKSCSERKKSCDTPKAKACNSNKKSCD